MASTASPRPTEISRRTRNLDNRYEQYIEEQLKKASVQVKVTDLLTAAMTLAAAALAFTLALVVIDGWLFELGTIGRWLAFFAFAVVVGYFVAVTLVPLIAGRINPTYAARAIEESEPSLKNSLVNFLMFRQDRAGLRHAVYHAMQHQAAAGLSHVAIESAIDRSRLIRMGYVLAGVLAICAAYTIVTPKSPFTTIQRVATPWREIARPSRVRIERVEPGDAQVFQGDLVEIRATCYDVYEGEVVSLVYSSLDGTVTRKSVAMAPTDSGLVFEATLPPDSGGLQQALIYWIEAGDATSATYHLRVSPAPTIFVESIRLDFPRYTQQASQTLERQGDIRALEGTRVTVRAKANEPLRSAVLQFQPEPDGETPDATGSANQRIEMQVDGTSATCEFLLELAANRRRPQRLAYQLSMVSEEGATNQKPILHRIEVLPDLPPEIEILTPAAGKIELAEDRAQKFEVRALDPDYGLSAIEFRGLVGDRKAVDQPFFSSASGELGQQITTYDFLPRQHGLKAGDTVTVWAIAKDNRTAPNSNSPDPNFVASRKIEVAILPPEPGKLPASREPEPEPKPDSDTPPEDEPQEPEAKGENGAGEKASQQNGGAGQETAGDQGDEQQASAGGEGAGSAEQSDSAGAQDESAGGGSGGQEAGGSEQSGDGQTGGSGSDASSRQGNRDGQPSGDSTGSDPSAGGSETGSRSEPLHDGEVFEKALQHIQRQQNESVPDRGGQDADGVQNAGDTPAADTSADGPRANATQDRPPKSPESKSEQANSEGSTDSPSPSDSPNRNADDPSPKQGVNDGGTSTGPEKSHGSGQQQDADAGNGGRPQGPAEPDRQRQPTNSETSDPKQPGLGDNGDSGDGRDSQDDQGAVKSQETNRDREKSQSESAPGENKSEEKPQSPSISKRQSDSKDGTGGDRSGGGEKGGGQGANQKGNDSAGSNTSADEGAGASQESGDGETADRGGSRQPSDRPTGTPSDEQGDGSRSLPKPSGEPSAENGQPPSSDAARSAKGGTEGKPGKGIPRGGGAPAKDDGSGFEITGEVPPGDKPNLEYARKATDLVLDYLKDQTDNPDRKLLDDLGWTRDDLQKFVQRWETLKQNAAEQGTDANRQLNDSLRSLGLRPKQTTSRAVNARDETRRVLRETGFRSDAPGKYSDLFNAYKKGTARSE